MSQCKENLGRKKCKICQAQERRRRNQKVKVAE
jgi:hypothetical protein